MTDRIDKVVYTAFPLNILAICMSEFPLILEPEDLAQQLPISGNTVIIEQASFDEYSSGHIPGSLWLDFKELQASASLPGYLPTVEHLSSVFGQLGIDEDTYIICSDGEGGGWAGRLIWILDCLGHSNYSFLNGGLTAWKAAGLATTTAPSQVAPRSYSAQLKNPEFLIQKNEIASRLGEVDFAIWDARSQAEYNGEKANSARGGHIPGARHYEWTQALDQDNGLRLRSLSTIKAELKQLGLNRHQEIVTHCQTHHRSGLTYVIGKALGFNIRGYAGSWADWGNDPNTPIALGSQP